jgi:D-alanine-D-alanine ligase-like ATP-grasp enzyme
MRICLLTDSYPAGDPRLEEGEAPSDPRPYLPEAEWEWVTLEKPTAVRRLIELAREGFDLFFNLCDGAWDEDRPGIEVVQTLERLGLPFTGATSAFYEPSREAMKRVCAAWGIDTPAYVIARDDAGVERAADTLRFPLIAKHPSSYGSVGITRDSRVESAEALRVQARKMIEAYGGALIEEFIDGREATVLVAENPDDPQRPTTYKPIEYRFPPGESFKHYDLKWVSYHGMQALPLADPALEGRLREASAQMFLGLQGAGYGRCDLRVDADGRAYMLEINPNCGLYFPHTDPGSADLCLMNDPAGHEGFTRQVVAAALHRAQARRPAWEVQRTGHDGYGLFATRPIRCGERIIAFEERPHVLVSRTRVERDWDELQRSWFERYAWPLTDELWVIWDSDPENWRPINHACEPSAWVDGLDLVARRDVRQGEEITMDYATLYTEVMPAFECACGAATCRETIRGDDYLQDFVGRYGDHVSDYVRRRRAER